MVVALFGSALMLVGTSLGASQHNTQSRCIRVCVYINLYEGSYWTNSTNEVEAKQCHLQNISPEERKNGKNQNENERKSESA